MDFIKNNSDSNTEEKMSTLDNIYSFILGKNKNSESSIENKKISTLDSIYSFIMGKNKNMETSVEKFQGGVCINIQTMMKNFKGFLYKFPMAQLTVDIIFYNTKSDSFLFIIRGAEPFKNCLAITGGFVDINKGESPYNAAVREGKEETGDFFDPKNITEVCTIGNNTRDPRGYTTTVVHFCETESFQKASAGDDARSVVYVSRYNLVRFLKKEVDYIKTIDPKTNYEYNYSNFAFDHENIIKNVLEKQNLMNI